MPPLARCGQVDTLFGMSNHERSSGLPPTRGPLAAHPLQTSQRNEVDREPQGTVQNALRTDPTVESLLNSGSSTHTQHNSQRYRGITIWWQELIAATLLCAAVTASYATLAPYAGKSLPKWPKYITISALLSTYSVVLRLAATFLLAEGLAQLKWRWLNEGDGGVPLHDLVLHDSATRGPVGSLQLLWRLPLPITWQWLGCVLVVLVLAVGPLTQLVLQYEQCSVLVRQGEQDAGIPRASVFFGQGVHSGAGIISLSLEEQRAINSGVYSLGSARPDCSTGNCTFEPYTSIGFCSRCEDISADLHFSVADLSGSYRPWVSTFIPDDPSDDTPVVMSSNYSIGSGFSDRNMAAADMVLYHDEWSLMMMTGPPKLTDDGSLVDCTMNSTWTCRGYAASTCKISPCIRDYTAAMSNGLFQEEIVQTWITPFGDVGRWPSGRYFQAAIKKSCLTEKQSSSLQAMNYTLDDETPWLAYNGSTPDAPIDLATMEQDLLNRQCLYAIDYFFLQGLSDYLGSSIFNGNITASYSASNTFLAFMGPQVMLAIYNNANISFERTQAVWENVSLSLTNHVRLNPNSALQSGRGPPFDKLESLQFYDLLGANSPALGLSHTTKTCLQVRWGWLVFPTVLALLTLVFFTGVLFSSGGLARDVRTWKSSPLPLLFYGVRMDGNEMGSQHVSDLERVARRVDVGLVRDEGGYMVLRRRGRVVDHDHDSEH